MNIICENRKPFASALLIWLLCFSLRAVEYFWLRTDQTIFGEAFIHKLLGIVIVFTAAKLYKINRNQLGFSREGILFGFLKGLLFGIAVFIIAYLCEIVMLAVGGNYAGLDLYVSAYAVDGNVGNQTAAVFFVLCILGNLINVVMEEGLFRGLFPTILEKKYTVIVAAVIASALFGVWHIMAPLRSYCDGTMSLGGFVGSALMLAVTSSLVGFKFAILTKLTGNLYMAMGDHFVNNTIVNMLHVMSHTGADQLMVIRIAIAQAVSFFLALVWYVAARKRKP